MTDCFTDLIEPIELLQPFDMKAEFCGANQSNKMTCNLGYVCKEGQMEIPD